MTHDTADRLRLLARTHLPEHLAQRWIGLLRPSLRLHGHTGTPTATVVGRLGGLPRLPDDEPWPVWQGHGPLAFVASLDCGLLPSADLDIALPSDGTLAFFYFDGQLDDGCAVVDPGDPDSWGGARVLYIPAHVPVAERAAPRGIRPSPEVRLTAHLETTAPQPHHPVVSRAFASTPDDHRARHRDFEEALWNFFEGTEHRVGGYATPVQGEVELEVARGALGSPPWDDPRIDEEALRWVLLAQFDTDDDADMMWGDCGVLYWLIRPEDLARRRFDRAMLTWQCG
ncbi:YwqG family protein [Streptomyces sp. NPDC052301]|uniref:YwqG family protein n=1 Tax=Streptomyces sp. NPDC052301 TaxID=3365687 RepID=UPI0037D2E1BE